jgi:hypothetical protein
LQQQNFHRISQSKFFVFYRANETMRWVGILLSANENERLAMPENLSNGILVVWTDVPAEHEVEFNSWYDEQHLPERLAVPGFHNARRYASEASPKYLAYYETTSPAVMASDRYVERLANPTEWTQRVMPWFVGTVRTVCNVVANFGHGVGGVAQTFTFSVEHAEDAHLAWLSEHALPEAASHLGCVRVQLWHDAAITNRPSPEQAMRPQRDSAADWVIIVEAVNETALREIVQPFEKALQQNRATTIRTQGPYQLLNYLRRE